ncbi:hypothetical protein [Janthinobacterium sp. CG_S6]|uniref:hypothetical protein n=1 Tax=Janthinobacterium sp. CG_S6 TaxID=3071707 RepID=UPI002DF97B6A|nr:hypothetical protein [Janthinobacterium sp. CG_S6]
MRQDQYEKLQALAEKLTDAFIAEADPDSWPGAGLGPAAMDQQTRGDRYWCKKNAAATLSVIVRTTSLIGIIQNRSAAGAPDGVPQQDQDAEETGLDAEVKAAEKEASKLLAKMQASMKKVHGK